MDAHNIPYVKDLIVLKLVILLHEVMDQVLLIHWTCSTVRFNGSTIRFAYLCMLLERYTAWHATTLLFLLNQLLTTIESED